MQKHYHELSCRLPKAYIATFTQLAFELGATAVEQRQDFIILRSNDDLELFKFAFDALNKSLNLDPYELSFSLRENKDWVLEYKNSVQAIKIGDIYIHSSWQETKKDLVNICIDPALAFGSGHHASTNACLLFLQKYLRKDMRVLDLGCGSGILAISAAKIGAKSVDACDIDEQAISSTEKNAKINKIKLNELWLGSAKDAKNTYDLLLVNIVADIILLIKDDIKKLIKPNGIVILSGLVNKQVKTVLNNFNEYKLIDKISDEEWSTLALKG